MGVTRRDVRPGERMVRHARSQSGVNVTVLVVTMVGALTGTLVISGILPGFRPAERLGLEVVTAVGGPLAQRLDTVASRSQDRVGSTDAGAQNAAPAAPARAGSLPTWTGGGVQDAADGSDQEPLTATETTAPATASVGVETATATAPLPTSSEPVASTATSPASTSSPSTPVTTPATATGSPAMPELEQRLVELTNAERAKVGCPALTVDARLMTSAEAHAVDMVAQQYFDHNGRDGSTPTTRGAAAGYPAGVAENIGTGFTDAAAVMTAWLASPGHRANIVDCAYKVIGVGYDVGALPGYGPGTWVQTFGSV